MWHASLRPLTRSHALCARNRTPSINSVREYTNDMIPSLKTIRITAVAAGCLGGCLLAPPLHSAAKGPANKLILQIEKKVHNALPTKDEKLFDQIAWVKDIRNAERLAKQNRRPIVLFTGDGNIGTGRC